MLSSLRQRRELAAQAVLTAKYRDWTFRTDTGRANARSLANLKGAHAGERCFIMGNGPSLLKCDLDRLADEVTIVSNAHFLIWDDLSYTPKYITVEDQLVAEDRSTELADLQEITKIYPFDLKPTLGEASDRQLYVNFPRHYRDFPRFSSDARRRVFWGGTVSYMNLQLAAHFGCNPIVLIGFDHNYVVPERAEKNPVIESTESDVNHIHPDYFGPGYRWHDPNVERMERSYLHARDALGRQGVEVINATAGGHLEVFPRRPFEEVVGS